MYLAVNSVYMACICKELHFTCTFVQLLVGCFEFSCMHMGASRIDARIGESGLSGWRAGGACA